jgi:hypothetical protein
VTKGAWADIAGGGYIAQAFAAPGQRLIKLDGAHVERKPEIRLTSVLKSTVHGEGSIAMD